MSQGVPTLAQDVLEDGRLAAAAAQCVALRRKHVALLAPPDFATPRDLRWHGANPGAHASNRLIRHCNPCNWRSGCSGHLYRPRLLQDSMGYLVHASHAGREAARSDMRNFLWHHAGSEPDWEGTQHTHDMLFLGYSLHDADAGSIYIGFNPHHYTISVSVPEPPAGSSWRRQVSGKRACMHTATTETAQTRYCDACGTWVYSDLLAVAGRRTRRCRRRRISRWRRAARRPSCRACTTWRASLRWCSPPRRRPSRRPRRRCRRSRWAAGCPGALPPAETLVLWCGL